MRLKGTVEIQQAGGSGKTVFTVDLELELIPAEVKARLEKLLGDIVQSVEGELAKKAGRVQ